MTFIASKSSALLLMGERVVFVLVNVGINAKVEIDKTSIKDHSKVRQLNAKVEIDKTSIKDHSKIRQLNLHDSSHTK